MLIVDLNNFSRYPTMSVGYFSAILRNAGNSVRVLSPFAVGVNGYPRVTRPKPWGVIEQSLRHWSGTSRSAGTRKLRKLIVNGNRPSKAESQYRIITAFQKELEASPDVIFVSAYTMFFNVCFELCSLAGQRGIPVVVGGPFFNQPETADRWLKIPGITGVFGGEPENQLAAITEALGNGKDHTHFVGLSTPSNRQPPAPPLKKLDDLPFPDYSDFPWDRYPNRIVPIMTGRGCGWGVCTFCSDVVTGSGRNFRSRSSANVLAEMKEQASRHNTEIFTFLDLKLNSNLLVWYGLAEQAQSIVPGCQWTASLHVKAGGNEGVSARDLKNAKASGLVRLTTGLESGSNTMLNAMAKGTNIDVLSQFVRHAHEAGISVRLTVIVGYPDETPNHLDETTRFLERHDKFIDRVVLNRFAIQAGTPFQKRLAINPGRYPQISDLAYDADTATFDHVNATFHSWHHKKSMLSLIRATHKINRSPLGTVSKTFEGVM